MISRILRRLKSFGSSSDGWTLTELLIVVAIFAILALIFLLVNWKKNINRAFDARRKADLANIRTAFEQYYNDKECYPPIAVLDNCGSSGTPDDPITPGLAPYLKKVPCDPASKTPYLYQPDSQANLCAGNRICTKLSDLSDPDIVSIGCDPVNGCGWGAGWNFCLATGATVTAPGFIPGVSPTPLPSPTPIYEGKFACSSSGICGDVGFPPPGGCPRSWIDANCSGMCAGNPQLWCP